MAAEPVLGRGPRLVGPRRKAMLLGAVVAAAAAWPATNAEPPSSEAASTSVVYATVEVQATAHDTGDTTALSITAVYATFSPNTPIEAMLVPAEPFDGCGKLAAPASLPVGRAFAFLSRLNANSSCTAVEQGRNAAAAGAVGVINMAPEAGSNYIWILQETRGDTMMARRQADIPHVAISGLSGGRLHQTVLKGATRVKVGPQTAEQEEKIVALDLAITVVCVTVAILVLLYAYRVGRSIFVNQGGYDPEYVDPERRAQLRARVSQILTLNLPAEKYVAASEAETADRDCCAICLDDLETGHDVRKLVCNHVFHVDCIDPWLLDHPNCPLCKDNIISPRKSSVGYEGMMASKLGSGGRGEQQQLPPGDFQLSIQLEAIPDTADAQGFIVGSESGDWQDEMGLSPDGDLGVRPSTVDVNSSSRGGTAASSRGRSQARASSTGSRSVVSDAELGMVVADFPIDDLTQVAAAAELPRAFHAPIAARDSPRVHRRPRGPGSLPGHSSGQHYEYAPQEHLSAV